MMVDYNRLKFATFLSLLLLTSITVYASNPGDSRPVMPRIEVGQFATFDGTPASLASLPDPDHRLSVDVDRSSLRIEVAGRTLMADRGSVVVLYDYPHFDVFTAAEWAASSR